ncbi:class I SAM-dependent methyltransferase [Hydrogenophaga sp.]|uniref:class I SAM-dependent methyltransferase n=1 Tax=Hydrogenophaga sp. TaxID=1904254 RepID=UPI00286DEC6A|nr:methyltransferase domain-containing protein [Hydrogenophaga sp.]
MKQTPAHDGHNPDLLRMIPQSASRLIEIGCSSGALARAYKELNPTCHYRGVDVDPEYAEIARNYTDECLTLDIEHGDHEFWQKNADRDCWIFGDTLEHLRDPWLVLSRIKSHLPAHGCVVACIPNAQHWSLQVRLCLGDFRYQDSGLLDRTHLRWFTRQTIIEMFDQAGFKIEAGIARTFDEPNRMPFIQLIEQMAQSAGTDSSQAVQDALPLQYVFRAVAKSN